MVTEEDRADLLEHGGGSETSERYCEPHCDSSCTAQAYEQRDRRALRWQIKIAPAGRAG
jgi:hypothetical protein